MLSISGSCVFMAQETNVSHNILSISIIMPSEWVGIDKPDSLCIVNLCCEWWVRYCKSWHCIVSGEWDIVRVDYFCEWWVRYCKSSLAMMYSEWEGGNCHLSRSQDLTQTIESPSSSLNLHFGMVLPKLNYNAQNIEI